MNLMEFFSRKIRDLQIYQPQKASDPQKTYMSILVSTLNKFASCNEVGGVEAASTLLGFSDHYTNAIFNAVNWKGWDLWLVRNLQPFYNFHSYTKLKQTNENYFSVLKNENQIENESMNDSFSLQDFKDGYLNRSELLKDCSLFQITMDYELVKFQKKYDAFFPLKQLSIYDTSSIPWGHIRRTTQIIPTLPWFNATSKQHGVGTECFARLMILLFKPFRFAMDLKPVSTFQIMFKEFKNSVDVDCSPYKYMTNLEKNGYTGWEAETNEAKDAAKSVQLVHTDSEKQMENRRVHRCAYHLPPIVESRNFVPKAYIDSVVKLLREKNEMASRFTNSIGGYVSELPRLDDNIEDSIWSFLHSVKTPTTCSVQWNCIKIVADHYIQNLKGKNPKPLRMIVLGEGGTGKSFVIDTLTKMFQRLNRSYDYVVCAPTGKAAINVKGDTIDGVFKFSWGSDSKTPLSSTAPISIAKYLIIDEISMVSKSKLGKMHAKLGYHLNGIDHVLGNKSFIFFGDFLQFPPVGGTSLISSLEGKKTNRLCLLGERVFLSIEYAFELVVQKRQDDATYLKLLRNIRSNSVTSEDFKYLYDNCVVKDLDNFDREFLVNTPVIVSLNLNRFHWNSMFARWYSELYEKELVVITAVDDVSCKLTPIIQQEVDLAYPDYLQRSLSLVIGMQVQMLENTFKHLGVVNGTDGILTDILFENNGNPLALQIQFPDVIFFQVEGLPCNTIIVERRTSSAKINSSKDHSYTLTRSQFPVTESFCSTDYKKQGQSLSRALIDLKNGSGMATYVKLSRTKRANSTFILPGFTLNDLSISYPAGYDSWRSNVFERMLNNSTSIADNIQKENEFTT